MRNFYTALSIALLFSSAALAQQRTVPSVLQEKTSRAVLNAKKRPSVTSLKTRVGHMSDGLRRSVLKATTEDIIRERPEGNAYKNLYHQGNGFVVLWGDVAEMPVDGLADDVVFAEDGSVYIHNPLATYWSNSYVKGNRADGDTIEVSLPQHIDHIDADEWGNEAQDMYLFKCQYQSLDDGSATFVPVDGDQTMKYVWRNDSLIMVNSTADSYLLGACDETGGWYGYGDYTSNYSVLNIPAVQPSGDIHTCAFSHLVDGVDDGRIARMATDGDDIYLSGISSNLPDAWIKGTVSGDKAVFAGKQYLGVDSATESHLFFMPIGYKETYNEEYEDYDVDYFFNDGITMDYNAEAQTLACDTMFAINQGYQVVNQLVTYDDFSFAPWTERAATPCDPVIFDISPYDSDYGYGTFSFTLDKYDAEGYLMDADKLYYNIYLDDKKLTFSPEQYVFLTEEMTDIPYDFTERYDLTHYSGMFNVVYYQDGVSRVGVQLTYTGGGETRSSSIVYTDATGIGEQTYQSPLKTVYTDLSGRVVSTPGRGIYIKTTYGRDGNVRSIKVLR